MMMGVPESEVDELFQNSKVNHRIAGFDEEEKRLRRRTSDGKNTWPKLPEGTYIFSEFRTLDIPGVELNASALEPLKLMHRLAADPGIVAVMTKHRWRVGIMSEMAPVGYVGVSPKCILGFNKNHGEEISLHLRTDDLIGFRKYKSIKKTLLYEHAYMVSSEHDDNFYALDKLLNEEAATLDWGKTKGYTLSGLRHSPYSEGDEFTNHASSSQKLGGQMSSFSDACAASVAAAYHRFANASNNALNHIHEEPGSDSSGLTISQEPDCMHMEERTETSITYTDTVQNFFNTHDASHNEFVLDPDESKSMESMESELCLQSSGSEPHADHFQVTALPTLTKASEELAPKDLYASVVDGVAAGSKYYGATECLENLDELNITSLEPDPDDSGLRENDLRHKDAWRSDCDKGPFKDMKDKKQPSLVAKSSCGEPDPDDSQEGTVVQLEPDLDDEINVFAKNKSKNQFDKPMPDSDDIALQRIQDPVTSFYGCLQKAMEMLRFELIPSGATSIMQTSIKILRNMTEHPDELKFRKLWKANPII